jgi:hypothetical protein
VDEQQIGELMATPFENFQQGRCASLDGLPFFLGNLPYLSLRDQTRSGCFLSMNISRNMNQVVSKASRFGIAVPTSRFETLRAL